MTFNRTQQIVQHSVTGAIAWLIALAALPCLAGGFRAAPSYSSAGSRVYGFGQSGRSFTYQPAPSVGASATSSRATTSSSLAPQYKLDTFTAPRTAAKTPAYNPQPHYFSGRMWYPRGY